MQQKKIQREHESFVNDEYMKKWIELTEKDGNERKVKEDTNKRKKIEVQEFQLMQMGIIPNDNGVPSVVSY